MCFLATLLEVRSVLGNLFQGAGTALQKALSPYVVRVLLQEDYHQHVNERRNMLTSK